MPISGAGGAVSTIAGQIAEISGAQVVGLVGSHARVDWLCNTLDYDAIQAACPNGVNVFFDNAYFGIRAA